MKKILLILTLFLFSYKNAYALITVDITRGNLDPLPIAVSPLHVDPKSEKISDFETKKLGAKIPKIYAKEYHLTSKIYISINTGSKLCMNICNLYKKSFVIL